MTTILAILGGLLGLGGIVFGVVRYIKWAEGSSVDLAQTDAALSQEKSHVAALEAAAADKRRERQASIDAASASVSGPADAAELLRRATRSN